MDGVLVGRGSCWEDLCSSPNAIVIMGRADGLMTALIEVIDSNDAK